MRNYKDITWNKYYDDVTQTYYYITIIPKYNLRGGINKLKVGNAQDKVAKPWGRETPSSYATRHNCKICLNAGLYLTDGDVLGNVIMDNVIISNGPVGNSNQWMIGIIEATGELKCWSPTTTLTSIKAEGCTQLVSSFAPLIKDGVVQDMNVIKPVANYNEYHPRNVIGQLDNGDYLILTSGGRGYDGPDGFKYDDIIRLTKSYPLKILFNLDGGGSTSTAINKKKINMNIDSNGTVERQVTTVFYILDNNDDDANVEIGVRTITPDSPIYAAPSDTRMVTETLTDRNNINMGRRYDGMETYSKDTSSTYRLTQGINNSNWKKTPDNTTIEGVIDDNLNICKLLAGTVNNNLSLNHIVVENFNDETNITRSSGCFYGGRLFF